MTYNVFSGVEVLVTKQLSIVIAVFGLLIVVNGAVADDLSDGADAYMRGDYTTALELFRPIAE